LHYLLNPANYDLSDPTSIPNLLRQHLYIVTLAMVISIAIAIPLGLLLSRYRRFYLPTVTAAGLLYSIPSLALLAILITITGLSLWTILIPLILYNQLALVRNTVAGIDAVDPLLVEVGEALGMTRGQLLARVTLPLALPVIVAGIRLASVTTIGIASLAGFIAQGGLGALIFMNITTSDYDAIAAGAILLAVVAIVADLVLLAVQTALNRGRDVLTVS
jgi:osmoprotectant transport system permease protein